MELIKFKQTNMSDLYVDLTKVIGIRPSMRNYNNSNGVAPNTFVSNGTTLNQYQPYDEPGSTVIICDNNTMFFVDEHISEVVALMEGRDPRPAKVLFGKT